MFVKHLEEMYYICIWGRKYQPPASRSQQQSSTITHTICEGDTCPMMWLLLAPYQQSLLSCECCSRFNIHTHQNNTTCLGAGKKVKRKLYEKTCQFHFNLKNAFPSTDGIWLFTSPHTWPVQQQQSTATWQGLKFNFLLSSLRKGTSCICHWWSLCCLLLGQGTLWLEEKSASRSPST